MNSHLSTSKMPSGSDKGKGKEKAKHSHKHSSSHSKPTAPPQESRATRWAKIEKDIRSLQVSLSHEEREFAALYNSMTKHSQQYGVHSSKKYGQALQDSQGKKDLLEERIRRKRAELEAISRERDPSSDGSHRSSSSNRSRQSHSSKSSGPPFTGWICGNCGRMIMGDFEQPEYDQCGCGHVFSTCNLPQVDREEVVGYGPDGRPRYTMVRGPHCQEQMNPSAERSYR